MVRHRGPPSQGWATFVRNHAAQIQIAASDLFVVPTVGFKLLYGLVILRQARRRLVRIAVTTNPTAEWIAGQVTEAFPWDEAPKHLIRDRDGAFGAGACRRKLATSRVCSLTASAGRMRSRYARTAARDRGTSRAPSLSATLAVSSK